MKFSVLSAAVLVLASGLSVIKAMDIICTYKSSITVAGGGSSAVSYNFQCNNDDNDMDFGTLGILLNPFGLPCNGCKKWHPTKHGKYEVYPIDGDYFKIKYNNKVCDADVTFGETGTWKCSV